jgi:predicted aconitase with swiveling domain
MRFKVKVINGWKGEIVGDVLITEARISFLGDVDMKTGIIVGEDIDIKGQNIKDKVLIFREARGSTVGSNVLYGLAIRRLAPKLIATLHPELITMSGAIFGEIPMVSDIPKEVFKNLRLGDVVRAWIEGGNAYIEKLH